MDMHLRLLPITTQIIYISMIGESQESHFIWGEEMSVYDGV